MVAKSQSQLEEETPWTLAKGMLALWFGFSLIGCGGHVSQASGQVSASRAANLAGVFAYSLRQGQAADVLQQYDAHGALLGVLESNRATGATTQTWTDRDHNVWELSSATRCLSRNGTCLGDTEESAKASGCSWSPTTSRRSASCG